MFPFTFIKTPNPLYEYERKRIRWLSDPRQLTRYTLILMIAAFVVSGMVDLALRNDPTLFFRRPRAVFNVNTFTSPITGLTDLSTATGIVIGFYYMFVAMRSVNQDVQSGKWDSLRLTLVGEDDLVKAKYAIAQIRAWRFMVLYMVLAILVAMLGFVTPLRPFFNTPDGLVNIVTLTRLVTVIGAILEPIWIMQALTALGLMIGLLVRGVINGLALIFMALIGLQLIQNAITILLNLISRAILFSSFQYARYGGTPISFTERSMIQLGITVLTIVISFGLYLLVQRIGLVTAFRAAYTAESAL